MQFDRTQLSFAVQPPTISYGYWVWSQPRGEGCWLECFNSPHLLGEAIEEELKDWALVEG